jgi:hypothetical protein
MAGFVFAFIQACSGQSGSGLVPQASGPALADAEAAVTPLAEATVGVALPALAAAADDEAEGAAALAGAEGALADGAAALDTLVPEVEAEL